MKEHEIRPAELLRNYLKLVEEDAQLHFGAEQRQEIDCVACDGRKISPAFRKLGFAYGNVRVAALFSRIPDHPCLNSKASIKIPSHQDIGLEYFSLRSQKLEERRYSDPE